MVDCQDDHTSALQHFEYYHNCSLMPRYLDLSSPELVYYKIWGGSVVVRKISLYGKAARDGLCRTLNIPC